MKTEDVSQRTKVLRDLLVNQGCPGMASEDDFNQLVIESRDDRELYDFLRFLERRMPTQGD